MKKINTYIIEKFKISKDIENSETSYKNYEGIVSIVIATYICCKRDKIYNQHSPKSKKTISISKIPIKYIIELLQKTLDIDIEYNMTTYDYVYNLIKINKSNIEDLLNNHKVWMRNIENKKQYILEPDYLSNKYKDIISGQKEF